MQGVKLADCYIVFQMRQGGKKGVLVACPNKTFDSVCGRRKKFMAYRESMKKYDGGPTDLEVVATSGGSSASRLNYGFIVQLLSLGVEINVRILLFTLLVVLSLTLALPPARHPGL